jgi:anti-sigma factor RsiW
MTRHPDDRQLHDYADGTLPAREHDALRDHLAACDACRADIERIRRLRAELASLPRDIQPPARVLAAVHAATHAAPDAAGVRADVPWFARPRRLAAAAVVLVAVSSLLTALLVRGPSAAPGDAAASADAPGTTDAAPTAPGDAAALVAVNAMERSYQDAIAEVQLALAEGQSGLSAETVRILESNLAIIDRALAEARTALRADPGNDALAALLRSGYERKLDVLRSVSSHARASS